MKTLLTILLSLSLISCVAIPSKRTTIPVEAGHLYKGGYINVRAPNSDGWHLINSSPAGMEFARSGKSKNESFGAQLLIFSLPATKTKEEFISLIKKGIKTDTDKTRFKALKTEYTFTESRGYPCIYVESTTNDTQAKTSNNKKESLLLQLTALYCRHPVRTDTGFSAIYSHRGLTLYEQLHTEAKEYINGVQVPDNAK